MFTALIVTYILGLLNQFYMLLERPGGPLRAVRATIFVILWPAVVVIVTSMIIFFALQGIFTKLTGVKFS